MTMQVKPKKELNLCQSCGRKTNKKVCNVCVGLVLKPIKEAEKQKKVELAAKKEALMTLSDYKKQLEEKVNEIVRLIDKDQNCISCNNKPNKLFAGHYHSVGSQQPIRFNLLNIYGQCYSCNGEKGGLLLQYGQGLINNFGKEHKEYCEFELLRTFKTIKLDKFEILEAKKIATELCRFLKLENKTYSPNERLELRKKFNNMIGIYL
jgi:hypothetical protein